MEERKGILDFGKTNGGGDVRLGKGKTGKHFLEPFLLCLLLLIC